MSGVLRSEPKAVVLVGQAAFCELTRSTIGPELLFRVYQTAFADVAEQAGYHIDVMVAGIVSTFQGRSDAAGDGFLDLLLSDSIGSNLGQQDSRTYQRAIWFRFEPMRAICRVRSRSTSRAGAVQVCVRAIAWRSSSTTRPKRPRTRR